MLSVLVLPMSLRHYLVLMTIGTGLSWCAWLLVLFKIDPFLSGPFGLVSFFLSLFLALVGTLSLFGFLFRKAFSRDHVAFRHVGASFRQALFFSLVVVGALLLRGVDLFTWWSMMFLVAGFAMLELFFLTRESDHPSQR